MPFEVKVDADACLKQLDGLMHNISGLEQSMSNEFFNWQAEDMHRHFPKVDGAGLEVSTMIYPRGRKSLLRIKVKNLVGGSKPSRRRRFVRRAAAGAHRPILRPALFEKLKERMAKMLKEAATWR